MPALKTTSDLSNTQYHLAPAGENQSTPGRLFAITQSHVLLLVFSFSEVGMEGVPEAPHFSHHITLMGFW